MRRLVIAMLLAWFVWTGSAALAVSPSTYVYVTENVQARRFSDSETPLSGEVEAGTRVQVVYELDGWVRVRLPGRAGFGWVPVDKTTTEAPEGAGQDTGAAPSSNTLTPEQRKRLEDALKNLGQ